VHDLLAFLAERMLEMNKEKQQEIWGFLGWLEGYQGAKVEDLTPKTKLQVYYEQDFEGFLAVLKKNRKKAPRYFLWVVKWFFVSVSLSPLWLARPTIKPTATEQNHRGTEMRINLLDRATQFSHRKD